LIAIGPAIAVTALYGQSGTAKLLILSQVILSMQLSFAVFPLVTFTSDREKVGQFVNPWWIKTLAWTIAFVIAAFNAWLLVQTGREWFG
jgi:manganese transport protein